MGQQKHTPLSKPDALLLAGLCSGAGLLIVVAVWLSGSGHVAALWPGEFAPSQTAGLFGGCGFLGLSDCTENISDNNYLVFYAAPATPDWGDTTSLSWHLAQQNYYGGAYCSLSGGRFGSGTIVTPPAVLSGGGYVIDGSVPSDPIVGSQTYTLQCQFSVKVVFGALKTTATVPLTIYSAPQATLPAPTLSIMGNGQNPTTAVTGQPVIIVATFTPANEDTLTKTAINDSEGNVWCGSGCTPDDSLWTAAPLSTKTYTFIPQAAGQYAFTPSAQTSAYPAWSNYGQSLVVTVAQACQNGRGPAGACISCNLGFRPDGNGNCVSNTCTPAWICSTWSACSSGTQTCTTAIDTNSCGTQAGSPVGSSQSCTLPTPSIVSFNATPIRVTSNAKSSVTFLFKVDNPPASCTIAGPNNFAPLTVSPSNGTAGSRSASVTLSQTTTFTLICGSVSAVATVGILPTYEEK